MKKRWFILPAAVLLLALVLTGCGAGSSTQNTQNTTSAGTSAAQNSQSGSSNTAAGSSKDNTANTASTAAGQTGSDAGQTSETNTTANTVSSAADSNKTADADSALPGEFSKFTTTDLDGNKVTQAVLTEHKLTMINVWATFCSPCIEEMPGIGEIAAEYKDKDFAVIGIPIDAVNSDLSVNQELVKTAKSIISQTGADYLHLIANKELFQQKLGEVQYVPTTYFVDSQGNVLDSVVGGMTKDKWKEKIDKLLTEVK